MCQRNSIVIVIAFLGLVSGSLASTLQPGQCENINFQTEFNYTEAQGQWREIWRSRSQSPNGREERQCTTFDVWTANNASSPRRIVMYGTVTHNLFRNLACAATFMGNGTFEVRILPQSPWAVFYMVFVHILVIDYDSYAVIYRCNNVGTTHRMVSLHVLEREDIVLDDEAYEIIEEAINTNFDISLTDLLEIDHSEAACHQLPATDAGRAIILDGACDPNITAVQNFRSDDFLGEWHEISRYFYQDSSLGACSQTKYSQGNGVIDFEYTEIINQRMYTLRGNATVVSTDGSGKLRVLLDSAPSVSWDQNVYVIGTDYSNFAVLYSCIDLPETNQRRALSWVLTRSPQITDSTYALITDTLDTFLDLNERYYMYRGRSEAECFYLPEPNGNPVVFRGQCDLDIPVVQNFNKTAYMGTWLEAARYPSTHQSGACNRAQYSENGDIFEVLNMEVTDQVSRPIQGTARVASDDDSGILEFTFIINNAPRVVTLYVLSTDYTSYSLLYGCTNLSDDTKRVNSWKMSRERTLSSAASEAIAEVIADIDVLDDIYYVPTSQADEACFYVPDVTEQAPLFRGQCASNINGQQNFDIQRFVGWWHEIESYNRDVDAGVCISSNFQATGNQISVTNTGVFDLTSQLTSGSVNADSNGQMFITRNNGSNVITEVIWVLATDYETYALLYSCDNVNDEYRRVWSAKYSKSRLTEFPAAAQTAMNAVIEENQLLHPQFYQTTDQSDSACFHYPEPSDQQVILDGQCDENIPVVQNFDLNEYTGRWYQIERYAQSHQSGTCTGSEYSLNAGVVTLQNWDIVDGALNTVDGTAVLSTSDGSGRLLVSLPINGAMTDVPLYILTTDYQSYSLAYSCVNINSYQRAIASWKLSRTRSMPAAGSAAIASYMAGRQELHQPYFIQVEQNDHCEEPSSSSFIRSSMIVILISLSVKIIV